MSNELAHAVSQSGFDIKKLSETVSRVQLQGRVSRTDVEPFIGAFPPTVSLDDFDDEPSTRGVEMALEGFAGFLKVGLAVAVVGAVGTLIYLLIAARKKGEKMGEEAAAYQKLLNDLNDYEGFLRSSILRNHVLKGGSYEGNEVRMVLAKAVEQLQPYLDKMSGNHALHCIYSDEPWVSVSINQFLTPEKASQKAAIDKLLNILPDIGRRISNGEQDKVIKEIQQIREFTESLSVGSSLEAVFSKHIRSSSKADSPSVYSLNVVHEVELFFEARSARTTGMERKLLGDIEDMKITDRIRGSSFEPAATRVIFESIAKACKEANAACDKLKSKAEAAHLSTEVGQEIELTIQTIQNNVKVTEKIMSLAELEQNSLQTYLKFLAEVVKLSAPHVEQAAREVGDSSVSRQLSRHLSEIKQDVKKLRN